MTEIEKGFFIEKGLISIDLPIGQKLKYCGKVLTPVETTEKTGCTGCFLIDKLCVSSNMHILCTNELREDKKNVIFKEVD